MSRMRRICKRCHHVRPVNGAGHCPRCVDLRDKEERRRPPKKDALKQEAPDPETEEELAEASTDPAPPTHPTKEELEEMLEPKPSPEPTPQATAVEGGSPAAAEEAAPETRSEPLASGEVKP